MAAETDPPYATPTGPDCTVNGGASTLSTPADEPSTSLPDVNGSPVTWVAPAPRAQVGRLESFPSDGSSGAAPPKPLQTYANGVLVDWLAPEAVPGGPTD